MPPRLPSSSSPTNISFDSHQRVIAKSPISNNNGRITESAEKESADSIEQQETATPPNTNHIVASNNPFQSTNSFGMFPGGNLGGMGMGGLGMGGMGMGGYGYGSPMLGSPLMGIGGPLNSLNQFLFSIQNVIFSLSQAVQIVGMNAQGLQQLLESGTAMFDHIIASVHELVEPQRAETTEERKRRRRIRALRWAVITAITYAGYKILRSLRQRQQRSAITAGPSSTPYHPQVSLGNSYGYPSYPQQQYGSNPYGGGYGTGYGSWGSYGGMNGPGGNYF